MPDIVNASEIALMESAVQAWYPHVCSITRTTKVKDVYGGETLTPAVIATGVKCDIQATVQTLRTTEVVGSQVESRLTYRVSFPNGTDIKFHDLVTITSVSPSREMVVASVLTPESYEFERQVICTLEGEPLV